jgi:hypothetical protein
MSEHRLGSFRVGYNSTVYRGAVVVADIPSALGRLVFTLGVQIRPRN